MRIKMGVALLALMVAGNVRIDFSDQTMVFSVSQSTASAEEGRKDRPREERGVLPAEVRGFSGQARGTVVSKAEGTFEFKVAEVLKTWKRNKATKPEMLAGRTIRVTPRWTKGDGGQAKINEFHIAFIRKLEVGQEQVLELINEEGNQFMLLELNQAQRELAGVPVEGPKREGPKRDAPKDDGP